MKFIDPNDLAYWYPKIKDIAPTPKTVIITTDLDLLGGIEDGLPLRSYDEFFNSIENAIDKIGGCPIFIRTGLTSAKHGWCTTCHVKSINDIRKQVYNIIEFSACASMEGLSCKTWAIRELLPVAPVFAAFGNMPVTQEIRYFVHDGIITHKQPYWPPDVFKGQEKSLPDDWEARLASVSNMEFDDSDLREYTKNISMIMKKSNPFLNLGYWSVDWLNTKNGWYLIDMALGHQSYIWDSKK